MMCTQEEGIAYYNCSSLEERLSEVTLIKRNGQSGVSGKTIYHHKVKAGKKPQGKFKSMKK